MKVMYSSPFSEYPKRVRWLMFYRVIFTSLLLGSTIIIQPGQSSPFAKPLLLMYYLIIGIFVLSIIYRLFLPKIKNWLFFSYVQITIDTGIVTLIIFMTGGYSSLFSFLYLVVIIYASILLFRKGCLIMAAICSIQYGVLVDLEYYGILTPYGIDSAFAYFEYTGTHVLYRITITMFACFAVAFLSGLLSEQERKSKKELLEMGDHVKRMEKMAAVGEMAAGLAHEIKNPIASLRGAIQILKEELPCNLDQEKLMTIILREADRLGSLVNDFLLFAKPPTARIEKVELSKAVTEVFELLQKDCMSCARITLGKDIPLGICIDVDPSHFRQIMWNLLLNALESIQDRGTIRVVALPVKGQHIVIKISDTGNGIPQEIIKSIFDPFFTTKAKGTGLGLSIVHRIMESYGGWINIESEPGIGATFSVRFKQSTA